MHTPWRNLTDNTPKTINKLYWLIGINVVVFFLVLASSYFDELLSLPAYLPALLHHFWTPLSYMFLNDGILATVFNLLWLYWMGRMLEEHLGSDRLVGVYLLGGLAGAIFYLAVFNIIPLVDPNQLPALSMVSGSSGCVIAIIVAIATFMPGTEIPFFFWPVKMIWIVVIYFIIDLINARTIGIAELVTHIGAAAFAFLYIKQLQKGSDWIRGITNLFKHRGPLKVASKNPLRKPSDRPRQDEVDAVLDKISKKGYDNLSKEEKEILFRASKNES